MVNISIFAHDGITSLYTGVGKIARESIRILCRKQLLPFDYQVNAITGKYTQRCLGFSNPIKEENQNWLSATGGKIFECENGSAGEISYGNIHHWERISANAAQVAKQIGDSSTNGLNINLCLDTPFAAVAQFFSSQFSLSNHLFVWIPHSTVLIHKGDSAIKADSDYIPTRLAWEKRSIKLANNMKRIFIGYIGKFMKHHLVNQYGADTSKLINFTNGIDIQPRELVPNVNPRYFYQSYGISPKAKLLISFGRLERYKGFDTTVKVGGLLARHNFQTVLFAQPYSTSDPIIGEYKKLFRKFNPQGIFVYNYDFATPHSIIRLPNSRILFVPSKAEPFGLIPEEARLNNINRLAVVCSNTGGFKEQIDDEVDGFLTNATSVKDVYQKMLTINSLGLTAIRRICKNGVSRLKQNYDLEKNLTNSIIDTISKTT